MESAMRNLMVVGGLVVMLLGGVGCVSQQQYDELNAANQALEARLAEAESDLDTSRRIAERRQATISEMQERMTRLRGETDSAVGQASSEYERLRARYESLLKRVNTMRVGGALDPRAEAALRQLAADNPQLFSFDAENGVVRVASDLTFASGSAEVRDSARDGLGQLADVLGDVLGETYDLRVEGHTDDQRMSNAATVQRFGDNRGLSLARARAVSEALQRAGLPGERIMVAGWGPHRPLVANNPSGGTRENRRVEIFVVATTAGGSAMGGAMEGEAGGMGERDEIEPMK